MNLVMKEIKRKNENFHCILYFCDNDYFYEYIL